MRVGGLTLMLCGAVAEAVPAQAPVTRPAPPILVFRHPFTEIAGLVELSGSRVLVGDPAEQRLVILGPGPTDAREIGRVGSGPREFRSLGPGLRRPGGGAWVADFVLHRLLPVTRDGELEDAVGFPPGLRMSVRAGDALGRIYGEAFGPRTGRSVADSMFIVRWDPATGRVDTVAQYDAGWSRRTVRGGAARPAYQALDAWVVLPNGDVSVLEAATYRVTVWDQGRRIAATSAAWEPVRVTQAERDAYYSVQGRRRGLGQPGSPPPARPPAEFTFPATLPAFDETGVWASPDGRIWVERRRPARDSLRLYDVLDSRGRLIAQVVVPTRTAIVGFGARAGYLAESNEVGERFVARFAYPEPVRD